MPFSRDPFLQLVPNRAEAALRRLGDLVWHDRREVVVTATEPTPTHRPLDVVAQERRHGVRRGTAWGRLFDQRWFHAVLPASPRGAGAVYLEWRDQGEATLHVGGAPYYGFDVAHRRVALPPRTREVWIEAYCCQTAIWHPDATGLSPEGSRFEGAFLVHRDDEAWAAWHDLQVLFDLMLHLRGRNSSTPQPLSRFGLQPSVDQAAPVYRQLLMHLAEAIDAFDTRGVPAFRARLARAYADLRRRRTPAQAVLTGHAHIDLVWLWPERIGEAKAVHTFASVHRLMELYPEFRFAYSQPASYRAVEHRAPALARATARRIRSGQWEATGALEVESDTMLPCGEGLVRSLLLGQEEFRRLRGAPARVLWLPDVFGYSGCLPQLMRLAGVEWFFTTKLTWSAVTRFPYSSFVWRGTDGSEVVAHVTHNVGYCNRLEPAELEANAAGHAQSHLHPEFLHPTGYGDGGGGPTEAMCERARRLSGLAGAPTLRWDHPEAFFSRLARHRERLPVHQGECYLEYHRGTYTTHGDLKSAFRALERAMQVREAVAVATGSAPDLQAPWRRLVFAQFHDYIPGSSIGEVYAEGVPELRRLAREQTTAAHEALERGSGAWQVFNPLPLPWCGWVDHPAARSRRWMQLAPLGSVPLASGSAPPPPVVARARTVANDRVQVRVDADGSIRGLRIDGAPVAFTGPAARAVLYADRPANYDAWDIDRHTLALGRPVDTPVRIRLESRRPDRAVLAVSRRIGIASTLIVRYILQAGEAVLRIEADIDWHEENTLLKLHFPTAYRGVQARFGAPFGSVLRGQQPGHPAVEAQWEVPGSRWAAVAHDGEREGLALVTEAKYGFSARDGELTVSLLRSARVTGCDDHRYAAPPGLSRHQPASPHSDQGRHILRLALGRYDACGPLHQHPAALADTLFTEPIVYRGGAVGGGLVAIRDAATLMPAWAQPLGEGAWLLRLHEVAGQPGDARIVTAAGWTARRCALDGSPLRGAQGREGAISYRPYEVVSVRLARR